MAEPQTGRPNSVKPLMSKRAFLTRNLKIAAAIAATAAVSRASPARAGDSCLKGNDPKCCFLKGAAIRTVDGWRRVEDLTPGVLVQTKFSGLQPIRWVGRYTVAGDGSSRLGRSRAAAVRICASALAPNVPRVDLVVTSGHSLLIDGLLFPAASLVNGETIRAVEAPEGGVLEFFHVKLDRHDVIDAEGAPAETMGVMTREDPNFAAYAEVYGVDEENIPACAPVAFNGGRSQLVSRLRSAVSPWFDRRQPKDVIRDRLEARAWRLAA